MNGEKSVDWINTEYMNLALSLKVCVCVGGGGMGLLSKNQYGIICLHKVYKRGKFSIYW